MLIDPRAASELTIRLSFFWAGTTLTSIVGSLMASGILEITGHGWKGWQYLFVIEGVLTLAFGVFALFYLPPSPTQTGSRFRGKSGWFTKREETIMVTRVLVGSLPRFPLPSRLLYYIAERFQLMPT
jgi:MFS family permease